jgi:hypothetical protein
MNKGRVIITGIVLSIVYLLLEYCLHGYLLKDIYMQTASIWRPEAEMSQMCWMMMAGEIIFAFFFAIIFAVGYARGKDGTGQGFRYGVLMGFLLAPVMGLSWYVILPIPGMLAVYWTVGMFVQMIIMGIVAGLVYKP